MKIVMNKKNMEDQTLTEEKKKKVVRVSVICRP